MKWLMPAKRWILFAMAGRARPRRIVAWLAAVTLLALASMGALLELPDPTQPLRAQLMTPFEGRMFADHAQRLAAFWSATPAMRASSSLFLAMDTLLFIPLYAILFTGLRARWDRSVPPWMRAAVRWRHWRWLLAAAVLSDLIENALAWLAKHGEVFPSAWQYATALKWAAVATMAVALMAIALARAPWTQPGKWSEAGRHVLEVVRDSARYLWLYAIPLIMLFGGLMLLAGVPQSREIMVDLGDAAAGATSRLTTLAVTGFMLVVWISACGMSVALVGNVDPRTPREMPNTNTSEAAVLRRTHQVVVGLAALVATNVVLVRMSALSGAALSVFIVIGCIGLWVVTARACTFGFKALGLPRHRRARPVAWRTVALLMLLYVLLVAAWRFLPRPKEPELRTWGLFRKPDGLWRFNADLIDPGALHFLFISALVSALFLVALALVGRRTSTGARLLAGSVFAAGMLIWLLTAWSRLGLELLTVQAVTIVLASLALWLLTHRTTLAEYQVWQDRYLGSITGVLKHPPWLSRWVRAGLAGLFGTLKGNVLKGAAALVVLFVLLPHLGNPVMLAQTGTLAVVFAALSIWGLLATWLLVYLPMRHGLGNWTVAPLVWLALVSALPRSTVRPDKLDNPTMLVAVATGPSETGNVDAPTLRSHFTAWRHLLPDSRRSPMFIVSAAGGGLRAAYWTAVLLAEMDDRSCGQFGRHVLAASGVSGGSLGLALYAAQRRVWQDKPLPERCVPGRAPQMRQVLSGDFLAPVAARLLFSDGPMALVPFVSLQRDRTDALSSAIRHRWRQAFAGNDAAVGLLELPMRQALPALFNDASTAKLTKSARHAHPVLYLNATSVETGRRVIASNVKLGLIPADPFFFDGGTGGIRLLTARTSLLDAAMHSARFPLISSAGMVWACSSGGSTDDAGVCTRDMRDYGLIEWGHLLDGGYFENSGLETLGDALQVLQESVGSSDDDGLPPVFLIAISNDTDTPAYCPHIPTPYGTLPTEARPTSRGDRNPEDGIGAIWKALVQVREARARLELERVVRRLKCPNVLEWSLGHHLNLTMTEYRPKEAHHGRLEIREPALGWLLSASSMRLMDGGIDRYATSFPFDLAACPVRGGKQPRGLLGSPSDLDVRCGP